MRPLAPATPEAGIVPVDESAVATPDKKPVLTNPTKPLPGPHAPVQARLPRDQNGQTGLELAARRSTRRSDAYCAEPEFDASRIP